MQITITLTDKEIEALNMMILRLKAFQTKECTLEDAIHECINEALYDESETRAEQEGM